MLFLRSFSLCFSLACSGLGVPKFIFNSNSEALSISYQFKRKRDRSGENTLVFSPDMSLRVSIKVRICPFLLVPRGSTLFKQIQSRPFIHSYELHQQNSKSSLRSSLSDGYALFLSNATPKHSPYLISLKGRGTDPVKIHWNFFC